MTISPWVKPGHRSTSRCSATTRTCKFIEDIFLNGERLDGGNEGRPDNRPTVPRGRAASSGTSSCEFDFTQTPLPTLVQSPCPTGIDTVYTEAGACQP